MNTDKLVELERKWRGMNCRTEAQDRVYRVCADELAALRAEQAVGTARQSEGVVPKTIRSVAEYEAAISAGAIVEYAKSQVWIEMPPGSDIAGCLEIYELRAIAAAPKESPGAGTGWRNSSDEVPAVMGWYQCFWLGRVEPMQWRGEYWHHTRLTRDVACPSHWKPLDTFPAAPTPPAAAQEDGK